MHIAYIANSRFPSERAHMIQMVHMCNAFASAGADVTLYVTDRPTHIVETPEAYYGTPIRFSVRRVPVPDLAGRAAQYPHFLGPFLYTIQRVVFARRVAHMLETRSCDLVYGRDEWILWLLTLFSRSSVVWESHEAKYSFIARRTIAAAKKLIVISEGIRDFYRARGVPQEKISVAHDAIDVSFLQERITKDEARAALGINEEKPVVMYIGGLDRWKGVDTLFRAAEGREDFAVYVIGGKEEDLGEYRSTYPHVTFLGPRPYKDLPRHQQAADVLVIPNTAKNTLSSTYTSPLKLFAHMAARRPLAVSRILSMTNVLTEQDAFFFTADDPSSLCATIQDVLKDATEAGRRADHAYKKSKCYTWQKRASHILDFLDS